MLLVRDLMGHSSITTTTTYAQFDRTGAAEAIMALRLGADEPSPVRLVMTDRCLRCDGSRRGAN
jgi:hypothetical protein